MRPFAPALLTFMVIFLFSSPPVFSTSLQMEQLYPFPDSPDISWVLVVDPAYTARTWQDAVAWVTSLNSTNYGGFNDWHLPKTPDGTWGYDNHDNSTKYDVTDSDLGHLYYNVLKFGNIETYSTQSGGSDNPSLFQTFFNHLKEKNRPYLWFGDLSNYSDDTNPTSQLGWIFNFGHGTQFLASTNTTAYALAIRKSSPVPEPASALLFLTGITALSLLRRR